MIDDVADGCRVYSTSHGHTGTVYDVPESGPAVVLWDRGGKSPLTEVRPDLAELADHPLVVAGHTLHDYRHGQQVVATDEARDDPDAGTVHLTLVDDRVTGAVLWEFDNAADPLEDVLGIIEPVTW